MEYSCYTNWLESYCLTGDLLARRGLAVVVRSATSGPPLGGVGYLRVAACLPT